MLGVRRRSLCAPRSSRGLRIEPLEQRTMLSVTPPTVTDVNVSSTEWSVDFVDYLETSSLGTDGYSIPVGSSGQTAALPWTNLDIIRITFNEDVDVQQDDLTLTGVNTTQYTFSDFAYDSQNYVATWTLDSAIGKDGLLIDLDGDGLDPVADSEGTALDGDWTNGSSTYASGDTTEGGDFEFRFNVLGGDANVTTEVTYADVILISQNVGAETGDGNYDIHHDIDGDGEITSTDYLTAYGNVGDVIPAGNPAGMSNDAPTTSGVKDIEVDEDAVDTVIELYDIFDDQEDDDDDLTYTIIGNTNTALFDDVSIDGNGDLTLDYNLNAFGEAAITVRATDTAGFSVETTIMVDVAAVNDAPFIYDFAAVNDGGDHWTISGRVVDVDSDMETLTVIFGGLLEGYTATIESDGTFSLAGQFPNLASGGNITAQTEDDQQAESEVVYYAIW